MAEAALALLTQDSNQDGSPDALNVLLSHSAFGNSKDNWKNRRLLTIGYIVTCISVVVLITLAWAIMAFMKFALDAQLANVASTLIWASFTTGMMALGMYTGLATLDTNLLRNGLTKVTDTLSAGTTTVTATSSVSTTPGASPKPGQPEVPSAY